MNVATGTIFRANGAPQDSTANFAQNEVDLQEAQSFLWVMGWCRVATGTQNIINLNVQFTTSEEGTAGGEVKKDVNFASTSGSLATLTTDGGTMTMPQAADVDDVGDFVHRVVYGETSSLAFGASGGSGRYINVSQRGGATADKIYRWSAAIMWPKNFIQNMKYISRGRTDSIVGAEDDEFFEQADERLNAQVSVLQADGNFYQESNI